METLLMGIGKQRTSLEARLAGRADAKALESGIAQEALAELAAQVDRVALAELAVQVAPAGLVVQVAQLELNRVEALELDQVEAELEPVQVVAAPEHDPAAVLLETKSGTAPHPRGLAPVRAAEEDLAAAVETMREPAAAEAATAWAAAV
ncbi:MAG TPA: hypothetical protein VH598_10450 [Verrucomicrobiae bacterium]|nr:hypothetical protein [Verrucomicrobiae bacterium]